MLAQGTSMLADARMAGRAVPAITTYTLESTRAIWTAAERTGLPVIIQAGSSSFRGVGREPLAAAALAAAAAAGVPAGVHLDHSTDPDEIRACVTLGYTSVMIDGSHLPFQQNIALTRRVVDHAHTAGVWVEGELGALPGDEATSTDAVTTEPTDPARAAEFAARTGVDALAVGTVHGFTSVPVRLDLDRQRIAALPPTPLVLHGASGLPDADVRAAVAAGVRRAYLDALAAAFADGDDDIPRIQDRVAAMALGVADKLMLLAGQRQPTHNPVKEMS
jgi:ketose-bisphosphate aldolase